MTETESRPRNRALVASFLFTDLVGYSKGTASEQYAVKGALSETLGKNLAALRKDDYRIKDTGDGALIAFLSNPEHALYMALAIAHDFGQASAAAGFPSNKVRTGLHIGAVKEAIDLESRPNFVGDGINAAQRIMDFAAPGQITASRAYFEAVSWLDSTYAALFRHLGASNDKHGRPHELYAIAPDDAVLERLRADLDAGAPPSGELEKATAVPPPEKKPEQRVAADTPPAAEAAAERPRKWLLPAGALAAVAIVASVIVVFMQQNPQGPASQAPPNKAATPSLSGSPAQSAGTAQPTATPQPATTAQPAATPQPGVTPPSGVATQPGAISQPGTAQRRAEDARVSATSSKAEAETPSASGSPKQSATTDARSTPDASAPPASAPRTMSSTRPSTSNTSADAQRKAESSAAAAGSSASTPAASPAPAAAATNTRAPTAAASARCRHILEKVQVGEPLTQDEKKELATSCR